MAQPDLIPMPFAENATPGTIEPIEATTPTVPQDATWSTGFPQVTMQPLAAGGIPPRGQNFNGVLNALSRHIFHMQGGGQYKWSDDHGPYSIGDVLQSDDGLRAYVSIVNNNTDNFNTNPSAIGTSWLPWSGGAASELVAGLIQIATTAEAQALTNDTKALTPKKLLDSGAVFAGEVRVFAGAEANIPEGWLPCNGAEISRTTYSRLFGVIGTTYGSGNGSTTFNLPDLRGEFIRGLDNGRGVDAGRALAEHQSDALQDITGEIYFRQVNFSAGVDSLFTFAGGAFTSRIRQTSASRVGPSSPQTEGATGDILFNASNVARTSSETRPRNVAMNYIIKY